MEQRGCLYCLKNIISARNSTYDLGHCNETVTQLNERNEDKIDTKLHS